MDALENWKQNPNRSVLLDPAAVGVVRAPTARVDDIAGAGTSRASRRNTGYAIEVFSRSSKRESRGKTVLVIILF